MPRYRIDFHREVTAVDACTRVIEARSLLDATNKAHEMASTFNMDCPDDATEVDTIECHGWDFDGPITTDEPLSEDD